MTKIDKKITKYAVTTPDSDPKPTLSAEQLHERLPLVLPKPTRPEILAGHTIKIPANGNDRAMFITVNFLPDGSPAEVFINSKTTTSYQWVTALMLTLSAAMRYGYVLELLTELQTVHCLVEGRWYKRKNYPSLIAVIAYEIEQLCLTKKLEGVELNTNLGTTVEEPTPIPNPNIRYITCPSCQAKTFRTDGGCSTCDSCGFSHCS
jgi:hypothetical protein